MTARHKAVRPLSAGSSWPTMNSPVQEISVACSGRFDWRLRWAATSDLDGLHAVACQPAVYRYLFDGKPPPRELILGRIEQSIVHADRVGVGLWVLEAPAVQYGGCVQIEPDQRSRSGELLYFLDCAYWGQGLATRMAWTAITQAFRTPHIDCVFAGADRPNQASIAVMRRLGMTFRRDVQYPLGPGVEYAIDRDHPRPSHAPALLSIGR
jgi:ribosomal-protein-alanine N-acetyltransferase